MSNELAETPKRGPTKREVMHLRGGVSDVERELLERLLISSTIKEAAEKMAITPNTAAQRLLRLQMRYIKAKAIVDEYEYYRLKFARQGGKKNRFLE